LAIVLFVILIQIKSTQVFPVALSKKQGFIKFTSKGLYKSAARVSKNKQQLRQQGRQDLILKKSISQIGQILKIAIISTKIITPMDHTNTLGAK